MNAQLPGSGNAYQLNGNSYVSVRNFSQLTTPFTISTWLKINNLSASQTIFVSDSSNTGYAGYWLAIRPNGDVELGVGSSQNSGCFGASCRRSLVTTIPPFFLNQWIHLTVVVPADFTASKFYINGVERPVFIDGSGTIVPTLSPNPTALIGCRWGNSVAPNSPRNFYEGEIDELVVWDTDLTQNQIREFMCKKIPTGTPNMLLYYKFDEANSGQTVVDYSSNNFNGVTMGPAAPRALSGAHIGDESSYLYQNPMPNNVLTHINSNQDTLTLSNITGNSNGMHIYTVNSLPTDSATLNLDCSNQDI